MANEVEVGNARNPNARLSDVLDRAAVPLLTRHLRQRIVYDVARSLKSFNSSLKECLSKDILSDHEVLLDFGLRAEVAVRTQERILKNLISKLGLVSFYEGDTVREIEQQFQTRNLYCCEPWGDLDREADVLNVAYFWSDYVKGETFTVTQARRHLYAALLREHGTTTDDIVAIISQIPFDSPVKHLFLGVALLEGLGCDANPEVAEQHFESAVSSTSDCDPRMRALATYFIARIKVERGQALARESMLALANQGNPFAQVFVSRAFASRPLLGSYSDMHFNELTYFVSMASTGYGVSQALGPLYCVLLSDKEKELLSRHQSKLSKQLRKLAKRSAESGNALGRALWGNLYARLDFIEPDECLLSGALCCLCNDMSRAEMWFQRAGKDMGLAFFSVVSETDDPYAKASWLTCFDYCYEFEAANGAWIELVCHKLVRDKLSYSLLAAGLDEDAVLGSIDYTKLRSIQQVLEASCYMPHLAADEFMRRFWTRYVRSVDGLRFLAGLYRQSGNTKAAMECYVAAAEYEGSSDAMVDISVMLLECGDAVKAEVWGTKGEFVACQWDAGASRARRLPGARVLQGGGRGKRSEGDVACWGDSAVRGVA